MQKPIENNQKIHRLQWACRRGMLELDVLLRNFLENRYLKLSAKEQEIFVNLLSYPDPSLYAWLLGTETPPTTDFNHIIQLIQQNARPSL